VSASISDDRSATGMGDCEGLGPSGSGLGVTGNRERTGAICGGGGGGGQDPIAEARGPGGRLVPFLVRLPLSGVRSGVSAAGLLVVSTLEAGGWSCGAMDTALHTTLTRRGTVPEFTILSSCLWCLGPVYLFSVR
jgi:hypothetical protein